MLRIRPEQLKILARSQQQAFEGRMAAHLRKRFPGWEVVADDSRLHALIRSGQNLSATYGIKHEPDVRIFLEFMTEYGPEFHTIPWAAKILNDRTLSGAGKIEWLDDYALFVVRK